ncbi:prepilin-type N-terminal cleavage/methylation domain-containing protein [Cellulomonas cellasea]|uniref:Prepilin-type N-terminal cleavage/methylation domain-containing protein n=2 Tax=Cellulomonas cellasea TaxID=43670 RepID=A0A0A0B9P3_9CELL|nr:prepilin-type N-terminal cleavage/methylation domain-containing protein [Cellulomonas cellasea]KGM02908.1 hypothetical protein Q760_10810 [Cellulomonas cellasea DSM 20118]GEA88808.1 hypothetical protein CCE01nite_27570 [Cellulomonas cellasea]
MLKRLVRRVTAPREDTGFSLIELLVAMMIITAVLVILMAVQTSALVTTAQSRQRTQATAVSNQILEELRSLPWLVLSRGLHTNFAGAAGGDANVAGGSLRPVADPSINEVLVTSSSQATDVPPLSGTGGSNKTVSADVSGVGTPFTSRVYVSRSSATTTDVLTLTVITTWTRSGRSTAASVIARSQAYAPDGGCGDPANQPFLGACQALLSSSGGALGPSITLTGQDPATTVVGPAAPPAPGPGPWPLLPGSNALTATLSLSRAGSSSTSQQATATDSVVTHGGVVVEGVDPATPLASDGSGKLTNAASNDVGASGAAPANPADVVGTGPVATTNIPAGPASLSLTAGTGTSGTARASTTASCRTGIPAGQPCSAGLLSSGSASNVTLSLPTGSVSVWGYAGGGSSSTFTGRFTNAPGTAAVGCATLAGAGCTSAGSQRTLGGSTFGVGPWDGGVAAANGLVRVASYTDSVLVERGSSQRTTAATATRSASVQYWDGAGYQTLTVTPSTNQTVNGGQVTWTTPNGTVTAKATVAVTPAMSIASNPDPLLCKTDGCSLDAEAGTLTVTVTYTLSTPLGSSAFTAVATYGTANANAGYKAAPDA